VGHQRAGGLGVADYAGGIERVPIFREGGWGEQMSVDHLINVDIRSRFDFPAKFVPL
jgi:hypothetical protein